MKLIADSRGRLTSAEMFQPGTTYEVSRGAEGEILLKKLVPERLRRIQVRLKQQDGYLVADIPAGLKVDEADIAAAVREQRDRR